MSACMRRSSMNDWGKATLVLEFSDSDAPATFLRRRGTHVGDERMFMQVVDDSFLQPPGAESVNHPHGALFAEQALVEEFLESVERLIDGTADQQQFA